jgi:hypothetical protein
MEIKRAAFPAVWDGVPVPGCRTRQPLSILVRPTIPFLPSGVNPTRAEVRLRFLAVIALPHRSPSTRRNFEHIADHVRQGAPVDSLVFVEQLLANVVQREPLPLKRGQARRPALTGFTRSSTTATG